MVPAPPTPYTLTATRAILPNSYYNRKRLHFNKNPDLFFKYSILYECSFVVLEFTTKRKRHKTNFYASPSSTRLGLCQSILYHFIEFWLYESYQKH